MDIDIINLNTETKRNYISTWCDLNTWENQIICFYNPRTLKPRKAHKEEQTRHCRAQKKLLDRPTVGNRRDIKQGNWEQSTKDNENTMINYHRCSSPVSLSVGIGAIVLLDSIYRRRDVLRQNGISPGQVPAWGIKGLWPGISRYYVCWTSNTDFYCSWYFKSWIEYISVVS